jgi:hypothetical protein
MPNLCCSSSSARSINQVFIVLQLQQQLLPLEVHCNLCSEVSITVTMKHAYHSRQFTN